MDSYCKRLCRLAERVLPSSLSLLFKKVQPLKNPYFSLKVIAVLLFIFASFSSDLFLKSVADKNNFYLTILAKMIDPQVIDKDSLFINQQKFSSELPQFILVENSMLLASTPPITFSPQVLGALVAGHELEDVKRVVTEYIVEREDTLLSLSTKFDISLNTILWANNLTKGSIIRPGQKLVIPPVSGVIHHVKKEDTIFGIAETYQAKMEEIIAFNHLPEGGTIYIGDIIIVPNGRKPAKQPISGNIPLASSYFLCPHAACRISQRLHWHNAIDFSGKCGDPIRAAAAGEVLKVALTTSTSRWAFGGAGNHITILHPNGVVTMYGHILASLVGTEDKVSQGDIIALMGGQPGTPGAGLSTGCHVHFAVTGAKNPFNR